MVTVPFDAVVPNPLILIVKLPPCVDIPDIACCGIFSRSKINIILLSLYAVTVFDETCTPDPT